MNENNVELHIIINAAVIFVGQWMLKVILSSVQKKVHYLYLFIVVITHMLHH